MNKIMSKKNIYVGIISILVIGIVTAILLLRSSQSIEGKWDLIVTHDLIGQRPQDAREGESKERTLEKEKASAAHLTGKIIWDFKPSKVLEINNKQVASWNSSDNRVSIIESNTSEAINYTVNFKNDSVMILKNISDTTSILKFQRP